MAKIVSLRSWNLNADNLDAMTNFYRDVLGAEMRTSHTVRGVKVNRLRLGGIGLGLFDAGNQPAEGVPHVRDRGAERLERARARIGGERRQGDGSAPARRRPGLFSVR